jgi:hypothetical protein
MNPETAWVVYLVCSFLLAVVAMAIGAVMGRMNIDHDEAEQERIERDNLPIMLRKQAD